MPMNERRRLAEQAKAIVADTQREVEQLTTCVARSRALLAESKLLLSQSTGASADVYGAEGTAVEMAGRKSKNLNMRPK